MRYLLFSLLLVVPTLTQALTITEVMSNPVGDDSGREWVELYNESDTEIDLSSLTVSVKGGAYSTAFSVSGGTVLAPHGYGIIASTVSGATKFLQDYPSYTKPLFRSSMSLVNTGVTSLDIKVGGVVAASLPSYTAAKEGYTYAKIQDTFVLGVPTPGEENRAPQEIQPEATTTPVTTQTTIAQVAPSADIVLYLDETKTYVAGAPSLFTAYATTKAGKVLDQMRYSWSFGDGGEAVGSSTWYRYYYPGKYVVTLEGSNGLVSGTARMYAHVVAPEIVLSPLRVGKYGAFVTLTNNNLYDLDISFWKIAIDGALFSFPKNTLLQKGVTVISGASMGFASSTFSSSTIIKLLFPTNEEVLRVVQGGDVVEITSTQVTNSTSTKATHLPRLLKVAPVPSKEKLVSMVKKSIATTTPTVTYTAVKKDSRVATFIRSVFR